MLQANLGLLLTGLTALSFSSFRSLVMFLLLFSTFCRWICFSDSSFMAEVFFSFCKGLIEYSVSLHERDASS